MEALYSKIRMRKIPLLNMGIESLDGWLWWKSCGMLSCLVLFWPIRLYPSRRFCWLLARAQRLDMSTG
jgi:hypothetical protein